MSRSGNKENAPAAVAHALAAPGLREAPLKGASAASPVKPHKRPIAEVECGACAEQLVAKAKAAPKRRCTETGIRKYASLSSMAATHALAADRKGGAAHKRADASKAEPSSEATVVLLSSDERDDDDEDAQASVDDVRLESQLTVVGRSSPVRLLEREEAAPEASSVGNVRLESQLTAVAPSSPVRLLGREKALSDAESVDEDGCDHA
ncbi:hypothetical protein H4R21_003292, partial [Coemansia helicoidea]